MGRSTRELLLVRHCASTGQAPDAPLSDEGNREARALARFLDGFAIDHVVSSPYRRALETIGPFAREHDLAISQDARLRERELSAEELPDWRDVIEVELR